MCDSGLNVDNNYTVFSANRLLLEGFYQVEKIVCFYSYICVVHSKVLPGPI